MFQLLRKLVRKSRPHQANSIENNLKTWSNWDWSKKGEEWSNNPEWKESLVEYVLNPNIPRGSRVLEIGPGGGRWTEYLIERAEHLIVVDLTPKCIELCQERFRDYKNIEYYINDGCDLSFIQEASLDRIWSFDVFVHIQSKDIKHYIEQFTRILRPGGQAIIHHSKNGVNQIGWRSDMTAERMVEYCQQYGLEILRQFDGWDNDRVRIWPSLSSEENPDVISVFSKPTMYTQVDSERVSSQRK